MSIEGGGGVGRLMANAILNFHFDYLTPSLSGNSSLEVVWMCSEFSYCLFAFLSYCLWNSKKQSRSCFYEMVITMPCC